MLLKEGVQLTAMDDDEKTVVYIAVEFDQKETLKVVTPQSSGSCTKLSFALFFQVLLKELRHTDQTYLVNYVDSVGNSPLHVACSHGDRDVVKVSLDECS